MRLVKLTFLVALVGIATVTAPSCIPFLEATNTYPDAEPCSYAVRTCQMHWLLCSGRCEVTTTGVRLDGYDRIQRRGELCDRYQVDARRDCADVREVSFEAALCADWREGWCDWEYGCDPRPEGCE